MTSSVVQSVAVSVVQSVAVSNTLCVVQSVDVVCCAEC